MADNKNDPQTPTTGASTGQKPDDAKISAGSSLGSAGTPPKPPGMTGASSSAGGSLGGSPAMGSTPSTATGTGMGAGSTGGTGAQSSTLASHTSRPLGGGAGPTGAGARQGSEFARHQDQSAHGGGQGAQGGQGGSSDQAREAADQIRERASDMYESASDWARDKYDAASQWASSSTGSRGGRSTGSFTRFANENPMLVGVVGLAAGLLLGALLPRTRPEDQTFGEWSDEVRSQGLRYASEAVHRGREYAEQAFTGDDPAHAQHESEFRRPAGKDDEAAQAARVTSPIAGQYRNH
ncbi:hypothetical protein [Salinarimonas soli]|uniref:hypothetical protein n=1 Tax=Salinarimonas soli TaxID=1638099 RepID=UPI001661B230|nr:hypothetical protein [Salinarimonas soli]